VTASATETGRLAFPQVLPTAPERCGLVGNHPAMLEVFRLMSLAAPTLAPVLIYGEAGTEREAIAQCLHRNSVLAHGPWMPLKCSAFTERQLEVELFGEESVSASGAVARRPGCLERSRGGTLFLDDVTVLTVPLQQRLLRALQAPRIERRRHGSALASEIRIITGATHDLREALFTHTFREDLYLRLSVVTLRVPRLADRGSDLLLLIAHFAQEFARRADGRRVTGVTKEAYKLLQAHPWNDNVRELRALVEHATRVTTSDTIGAEDLPMEFRLNTERQLPGPPSPLASLSEIESRHIARVLHETHGVIHRAAEILGVHRNTLTRKIRQYGITAPRDKR
jgi:DNA-binding NtrC family response regulator